MADAYVTLNERRTGRYNLCNHAEKGSPKSGEVSY